ncbi:MAG: mechanosensitive ion channel family protein [Thermotogota bacterium]
MRDFIYDFFIENFNSEISDFMSNLIIFIIMVISSLVVYYFVKYIFIKIIRQVVFRTKTDIDNIFFEKGVFHWLTHITPALVIWGFSNSFLDYAFVFQKLSYIYITYAIIMAINSVLRSITEIFETNTRSKYKPVKGFIQLIQVLLFSVGAIIITGVLIDRSFIGLLSGIGAIAAVLMIIFKDTLLSLTAHVQISANHMIKKGDWISFSNYEADGVIKEMNLNTVKVQNWDNTFSYIPTWAFISESFINWKGMENSGGRRIKKHINLDVNYIKKIDENIKNNISNISGYEDFIKDKNLNEYTNIALLREYVEYYIKNHRDINEKMIMMVRYLQNEGKGLPMEVYAFSKEKSWVNYEGVQNEIFQYIYSIIPFFDLRVYQYPSNKINLEN